MGVNTDGSDSRDTYEWGAKLWVLKKASRAVLKALCGQHVGKESSAGKWAVLSVWAWGAAYVCGGQCTHGRGLQTVTLCGVVRQHT